MKNILLTLLPFCVSFIAVALIHPYLVRFAKAKNIVDNPNTRKLQVRPVPVLGGIAILFGIMLGTVCSCALTDCSSLFVIFGCMLTMTYVGALDDVLDISPKVRLVMQIFTALILIHIAGLSLNNFHGLWGIYALPETASTLLTVVAVVGIINALNLIDGADGLFSIFCICVCSIFASIFLQAGDYPLYVLAVASIGAVIPFLLHNAFGIESKMFVGDGGSLLMGVVLSVFVMEVISNPAYAVVAQEHNFGLVAFAFAVLAIPVFDTLRVMIARIVKGGSPLVGDKTHLHHMFIGLGISHIGTAVLISTLNLLIVYVWWLCSQAGLSADAQFYVVVAMALLVDCGTYYFVALLDKVMPERMAKLRYWKSHHRPSRSFFDFMRKIVDAL
ncbi:MAG: undecaprenyl/decaprenyl-phosphate alpha-N-acetylglucosaminyl 1-phosphate transferase [Alistipes sp.]|nr:undecaprenyl/decaprenyl-phosphate alpha-N-acetylglucosaminyl 1-phosphate transferase [Alistipes sp.]